MNIERDMFKKALLFGAVVLGAGVMTAYVNESKTMENQFAAQLASEDASGSIPGYVDLAELQLARLKVLDFEESSRRRFIPQVIEAVRNGQNSVMLSFPDLVKSNMPRWYEVKEKGESRQKAEQAIWEDLESEIVAPGIRRGDRNRAFLISGIACAVLVILPIIRSSKKYLGVNHEVDLKSIGLN